MYGHHHPFGPPGVPGHPQQPQQPQLNPYFSVPQPLPNPFYQYPNPNLNPNLYLQNPSFSTPPPPLRAPSTPFFPNTPPQPSPLHNDTLQRIDQAVSKAHRDLLATGESVSAFKVSHSVLLSLKADSWSSLGFQMQQIPSLYRLMLVEGKVNTFIHCFVGVRRITSLHDLDVEICKNEGVQRFDELELGPLLRHPLVVHYFLIPSDTKEIISITSEEIISHLVEFMDLKTHKGIKAEEFLAFLAEKRSLSVKEKLGIRIQNLRMYVTNIREARKTEDYTLNKYILSMKRTPKEGNVENKMPQPSISDQKKVLRKRYFSISRRIESFSPLHNASAGKHVRFVSSSSDDEEDDDDVDDEDVKDENVTSSQSKVSSQNRNMHDQRVSSCPYPSATEEKARLGLRTDVGEQSPLACDKSHQTNTKGYSQKLSAKKRKPENQSVDKPLKLSKRDNAELSGHVQELRQDSDGGKSRCTEVVGTANKLLHSLLTDDAVEQFITTWKEACALHSVAEVFDRMLQFYNSTDRQRKKMKSMFKSFPCNALLHVAVSSIKYGMWDSLYDSFQAIGGREYANSSSTHTEPENISIEPSSRRDALSIKELSTPPDPCISVDDISKKASTYFELEDTTVVEGKSVMERQFKVLRKLHDWHTWLTKQFSVSEFGSLGHGDFYRFLEEHPSLIPNDLLESLFGAVSKKSSFKISIRQHQLAILLSQAASFLQEKDTLTKEHVCKLMAKQFPVVSLQLSDDGLVEDFSEFVKKNKKADSSSSILFSATLLGTDCVRHSLVQNNINLLENTGAKLDNGLISGALGSVSAKEAVQCLLKAPMLSDLQLWSHWDLIYAPTLGPLIEWLLNEVHMKELLCLVTKDGKVIRIDNSATIDEFLEALLKNSTYETAGKLLSLFALYGGERHVPLSLLKSHAQRGIETILINSIDFVKAENNLGIYTRNVEVSTGQSSRETDVKQLLNIPCESVADLDVNEHRFNKSVPVASRFILDCLCYLPSEFRSLAADVLVSGLQSFVKNASLAILHECNETHQRLMLHEIGLSLNICEWIADYHAFSSGAANDLPESIGATRSCLDSELKHGASDGLLVYDDKKVIGIESDAHMEAFDEGLDNRVKASTNESGGGCKSTSSACDENQDGALIIESIRREEFGLVSTLTEVDNNMLKKQHARLGRALQCLSQELYSQDSHFLLELVQNADDNLYSDNVEPTLVFILQSSGIVVLNNEQGFTAKNIRALCDVGNSTKKGSNAGYIGNKGIGFKSVFRVTDSPEIHSKGFNVKFDISEGQIGFVLPTVVSPCDIASLRRLLPDEVNQTDTCWNTCIVLPFKQKLREGLGLSSIVSLFSDLHPSLLLFLHRLQCIKFKNMLNDTYTVMKRETLEDGIVKVSHGEETMSWFVATQNLQASIIRPDVQTTKISVAFTLKESSDRAYRPHLEQQPVFAFLPLRTYGLKFILQGDFILPSSREEVDADSAWNQWLLSEFPGLFVSAQRSFCDLRCFQENPGRAVTAYMSFVPLVGEVHGFFSQLPRMIISKLRTSNCLLVEGKEEWVPPCRVVRGWNDQARILIPDCLLHQHLGLDYLNKHISLSDSLAKALGVYDYGPRIIVEIISSICSKEEDMKSLGLNWLSSCLSALYMMSVHSSGQGPVDAWVEADLHKMLRKIPFIPLSDGTYSSIDEGTIWLTCDALNYGTEAEHEHEAFSSLYANLRLVSPAFLSAATVSTSSVEDSTMDNVIKILLRIGVQRLAAHELIKVHILPALSENRTAERNKNLMKQYLSFVMLHLQSTCPSCHTERDIIMSELRTRAFILTNHGYKRSAEVPIHFSREFGNPVDMTKLIDVMGSDWHEVDVMYLNHSSCKSLSFGLMKWREFFEELGITDFVQTVQVEKSVADLSPTLLDDLVCKWDLVASGFVGKDWASPELVKLLSTLSSQENREKSMYLVEVLDKMWDNCFHAKVTGCCIGKSNEDGVLFKSSFINSFNGVQWMASSTDEKLHYPKDLFFDCEEVRSILGNFAPYAVPQVTSRTFSSDIGLKNSVTINDALEIFQDLQSYEAPITTSIDQMSKLYAFLWGGMDMAKAEISRGLTSRPSIFVPFAANYKLGDVISGKLFAPEEVYWHDPTGSVDLTKELLLQSGSLNEIDYSINKTLAHAYPSLQNFFVNECRVCEIPPPRSYIQILVQLSKVALPSQAANAVSSVLLKWANDFKSGLLKPQDVAYLKECLLQSETTVLPTVQDKWVSLHPTFGLVCWCDNEELWKQFKHSGQIDFLDFGENRLCEKEEVSAKISGLMQALGVPSISEVITREAIFYGMDDCREKALLVNWVLPYAQRYIYKLHPEKYLQLKQSGFQNICNLRIVLVEKLYYRHTVKGHDNASNKRTECSCLLQENNLYVVRASNSHSIFLELSRLFFNGTPELHLANFLHMITTMAESGSTPEQTEIFVVNSQKIPKLLDDEPVWFLSSLSSQQADDRNTEPSFVSATFDEQNSKFKRKPSTNANWPPADWKTAPDFGFARENRLKTNSALPPTDRLLQEDKTEGVTRIEDYELPDGTSGDWIIEDNSLENTTALVLQDVGAWEDKPLYGSTGLISGRTTSSSDGLNKAAAIDSEHIDRSHFNERDQLSFGTPNESQAAITGRKGELVAFRYFAKKVSGAGVRWVNEITETGLPYDIVIGEGEGSLEYIEVKATISARKDWFMISTREWQFAVDKGDSYSIAHVFLTGQNSAKVTVFKNPVKLCQQGALRLAVLMPKGQDDLSFVT